MIISFWKLQKIKITYDTSIINHSVYFKPSAPTILELSKSLDHFKFSPVKKFLLRKLSSKTSCVPHAIKHASTPSQDLSGSFVYTC